MGGKTYHATRSTGTSSTSAHASHQARQVHAARSTRSASAHAAHHGRKVHASRGTTWRTSGSSRAGVLELGVVDGGDLVLLVLVNPLPSRKRTEAKVSLGEFFS